MTQSPVLEAERRARRSWFADGLPSLVMGTGFLAMGLCFYLNLQPLHHRTLLHGGAHAHSFGLLSFAATLLSMVLYFVIIIRQKQIIEWLKTKITYPRTGYAAPPYSKRDETAGLEVVALLDGWDEKRPEAAFPVRRPLKRSIRQAILISLVIASIPIMLIENAWICVVAGIMWAAAFWLGNYENWRVSWLVLIGLPFIGFFMAAFPVEQIERIMYFLGGMGLLFVLDGVIALIRYIRRNPVVQP